MKIQKQNFVALFAGLAIAGTAFAEQQFSMERFADRIELNRLEGTISTGKTSNEIAGGINQNLLDNNPGDLVGSIAISPATAATPFGITAIGDTVYVANHRASAGNLTVFRYTYNPAAPVPQTFFQPNGNFTVAGIDSITGLTSDGNGNLLFMKGFNFAVSATGIQIEFIPNPEVHVYNIASATVTSSITPDITNLGGANGVAFNGIAYDNGDWWAKEVVNSEFVKFDATGNVLVQSSYTSDDFAGGFGYDPVSSTIHDVGGNASGLNATDIFVLDNSGTFLGGNTPVAGITWASTVDGRFFNNCIRKDVDNAGNITESYFAIGIDPATFTGANLYAFEGASTSLQPNMEIDGENGVDVFEAPAALGGGEFDYMFYDFGDVVTNTTSTLNLTISNTGQADLQVDSISVEPFGGSTPAMFNITNATPAATVSPGNDLVVDIEFTPTSENTSGIPYFIVIRVHTNDENPYKQALIYGNGVAITQPVGGFLACLPNQGATDQTELKWTTPGVALTDSLSWDDNVSEGGIGAGANTIEGGNKFQNTTNSVIYVNSISLFFANTATSYVGDAYSFLTYTWNPFSNTPSSTPVIGGQSQTFNVVAADVGVWKTLDLQQPVAVNPGDYFVAIARVTSTVAGHFAIGFDDQSAAIGTVFLPTNHWVRINQGAWTDISTLDPTTSIGGNIPQVRANYRLVDCIAGPTPNAAFAQNDNEVFTMSPNGDISSLSAQRVSNSSITLNSVKAPKPAAIFGIDALQTFKIHSGELPNFVPNSNNIVAGAESIPFVNGQDVYSFIDNAPEQNFANPTNGVATVHYKIVAVYDEGDSQFTPASVDVQIVDVNDRTNVPAEFELVGNFPNPFNPTTNIEFTVANRQEVTLSVFNINGQLVKTLVNGTVNAGNQNVTWDATDNNGNKVASGIYFSRFSTQNGVQTKKMVLLK